MENIYGARVHFFATRFNPSVARGGKRQRFTIYFFAFTGTTSTLQGA